MLQISQLTLPVDHADTDIRPALLKRLGVADTDLRGFTIKQRAIDARRQHVSFSYTLLAEVENESRVLKSLVKDTQICAAPDETYRQLHG